MRPIRGKGNAKRRRTARGRKRVRQGPRPFAPIPDERLGAERFLDKFGVANRLAVKPRTVAEWANEGRLPAYRIGLLLRFKWTEVEGWLAKTSRVGAGEKLKFGKAESGNGTPSDGGKMGLRIKE